MRVLAVTVSDRVQWQRRLCAAGQHQEVLLHETAVSWIRKRMALEKPKGLPWYELSLVTSKNKKDRQQ